MLTTILLLGWVLTATITDTLRHKIYNWTTYAGILVAMSFSAVGSALLAGTYVDEEGLRSLGWISLRENLLGLMICGFTMLVCFVMFRVGGGDVKLMAMLGAFLGPEQAIMAMLWTFVLGACVGLIALIWRVGPMRTIRLAFRRVASACAPAGLAHPHSRNALSSNRRCSWRQARWRRWRWFGFPCWTT